MKYEVRIFPNGRVVLFPSNYLEEALSQEKEILIICNAWSGGYSLAIGGDYIDDEYYGEGYMMYSREVKETELFSEDFNRFYKVIFTPGLMIRMETGEQANSYQNGKFFDWNTSKEEIHYKNISFTDEEIFKMRKTIDEKGTVYWIRDKEKVKALINYGILSKESIKWLK